MRVRSKDVEARILRQDKLLHLVEACLQDYELIAPVDESSYREIASANELFLSRDKPARSPKEFALPQRETLLQYSIAADGTALAAPPSPTTEQVLFGVRPCDAAAFGIVDQVFRWDDTDSLYFARRERMTIVSIACDDPCDTCFCTSLGGSPAGIEGSDLLLTPLRESYHVQIVTERGWRLVEQYDKLLEESDSRRNRERAAAEDESSDKITEWVDLKELDKEMDFEDPIWQTLTQECVDCGICTFLCPTCHCFDIQDEGPPDRGERVRLWDACMFYEYTQTNTGQPRPTHAHRYRQRILHKFQYYPQNFGRVLCVGCGRCIQHCPVGIDLRQVLRAVRG